VNFRAAPHEGDAGRGKLGNGAARRHHAREPGVLSIKPFRRLWIALSLSSLGDWLSIVALTALAPSLATGGLAAKGSAVSGVWLATLVGGATPAFWLGQVLVLVFAAGLGWLPVQGMTSARGVAPGIETVVDVLRHLVLPVATLGFLQLALITRVTRSGLIDALREEYIRTAYAKGLRPSTIVWRHALRNVLLPIVTIIGSHFGTLLTGAVLTEIIFAWPGLGRLLFDATTARDYPLLMAMFFVASLSVIVANLLTDIAYTALDPRVRLA